jgi:hypothetical protein
MIGSTAHGRRLYLIEWKYTESYDAKDQRSPARAAVYDHLIADPESPFIEGIDARAFYFEPFYQMTRQTLMGWLIARHEDFGCTSFRHVHVVPKANSEFHERITSPLLSGASVTEAWLAALKSPEHYIPTTPEQLLAPVAACPDTASHLGYLRERYWA